MSGPNEKFVIGDMPEKLEIAPVAPPAPQRPSPAALIETQLLAVQAEYGGLGYTLKALAEQRAPLEQRHAFLENQITELRQQKKALAEQSASVTQPSGDTQEDAKS